jgi:hypothetical protein
MDVCAPSPLGDAKQSSCGLEDARLHEQCLVVPKFSRQVALEDMGPTLYAPVSHFGEFAPFLRGDSRKEIRSINVEMRLQS